MGLSDPPFDDAYLLRFLRARKFDLKKTEKMFVDYIQWRKQENVDNIDVNNFFQLLLSLFLIPYSFKSNRSIAFQKLMKLKHTIPMDITKRIKR